MKRRYSEGADELLLPPEKPFPTAGTKFIFRDRRNFQRIFFYDEDGIYAVLMSGRDFAAVLVKNGEEDRTILSRWKKAFPEPPAAVNFLGTFFVDTRDGEKLATDVYLPKGEAYKEQKFPLY